MGGAGVVPSGTVDARVHHMEFCIKPLINNGINIPPDVFPLRA